MNLPELCDDYRDATSVFVAATEVALAHPDRLDRSVANGWSARQVIHHVADSEVMSSTRLRRLLAEPDGGLILGYDENAWSHTPALGYATLEPQLAIDVFVAVRAQSLAVLHRLGPDDLAKWGEHSESGRYDVATWLETYRNHPRYHAQQLLDALEL